MLYGGIAASEFKPARQAVALPGSANFVGAGNFSISASLASRTLEGSATFAGAGSLYAYLSSPEDSATTDWVAAVVAAGGSVSSPRRSVVNDLIVGLKADGIWDKLDRLWLFAAENATSALIDLVADATATRNVPNPTFTTDRGFTGVGAGSNIDMGFNQASGTPKATQNDTHFSVWNRTNPVPGVGASTAELCGADPGGGGTYWLSYQPDASFYFRTNDNGAATALGSAFTTHAGHFISSRSSSTQRILYQDGVSKFTTSATSQAVPNANHLVLINGTAIQLAAYSVGSNLNGGSDASNFYTRLSTYMTAVGAA